MQLIYTLQNHQTLSELDLMRCEINEDTAAAVIQTLYNNAPLRLINLDGNPLTIVTFKDNFIKPYFSSRKDLKINLGWNH